MTQLEEQVISDAKGTTVNMKLEVVVIPISLIGNDAALVQDARFDAVGLVTPLGWKVR